MTVCIRCVGGGGQDYYCYQLLSERNNGGTQNFAVKTVCYTERTKLDGDQCTLSDMTARTHCGVCSMQFNTLSPRLMDGEI